MCVFLPPTVYFIGMLAHDITKSYFILLEANCQFEMRQDNIISEKGECYETTKNESKYYVRYGNS